MTAGVLRQLKRYDWARLNFRSFRDFTDFDPKSLSQGRPRTLPPPPSDSCPPTCLGPRVLTPTSTENGAKSKGHSSTVRTSLTLSLLFIYVSSGFQFERPITPVVTVIPLFGGRRVPERPFTTRYLLLHGGGSTNLRGGVETTGAPSGPDRSTTGRLHRPGTRS